MSPPKSSSWRILWTARSGNAKTGDMPQAWIGTTRAETLASCRGCSLLSSRVCYAWAGTPLMGLLGAQRKASQIPDRYTLRAALAFRSPRARAVRLSAVGDAGRLATVPLARIQARVAGAGLVLLAYTHHWRKQVSLLKRRVFMASCDDLAEADQAIDEGWKVAAVVAADEPGPVVTTPKGRQLLTCPAVTTKGATRQVTCNDCRLCSPEQLTRYDGVVFPVHGNGAKHYQV